MQGSFKTSAPGKLFLLGEHAVLRGRRALVCAVDQRMTLLFNKRNDKQINIKSDLGEYKANIDQLVEHPKFRFIITALRMYANDFHSGFDLEITSDFSDKIGLGSSAAVTAAMLAGIFHLMDRSFTNEQIFEHGMQTIQAVQGTGSGADLAASVFGGVLNYRMEPKSIVPVKGIFPITVVYSGSKLPTTHVIEIVNTRYQSTPNLFESIFDIMDASVKLAVNAIENEDLQSLGNILNLNQGLMDAIGVSNYHLAAINDALRAKDEILGSKISGSGLGDCLVAIGKCSLDEYDVIPLSISEMGLKIEQI